MTEPVKITLYRHEPKWVEHVWAIPLGDNVYEIDSDPLIEGFAHGDKVSPVIDEDEWGIKRVVYVDGQSNPVLSNRVQ